MTDFSRTLLEGERALVTGGGSGLGAHFCRVLARHGAQVLVAGRRYEALAETVRGIEAEGGRANVVLLDVRDADSVRGAVEASRRDHGVPTILVNNSGIAVTKRFLDQSEEDLTSVVDTNLAGAFRVAQAVAREMVAGSVHGRILNVGSIVGLVPAGQLAPYAASKAGLLHLTRSMAVELARHHIRVNALAPGYFSTDINSGFFDTEPGKAMLARVPMRRLGALEELDGALLYLVSRASSFVTGAVLAIDGGHSIHPL